MRRTKPVRGSIYLKLIGVFVIMAVILELFSAFALLWGQNFVRSETILSATQDLQMIGDELNHGIEGIEQAKHQLLNSMLVRKFALGGDSMSKIDYYMNIREIYTLLTTIVYNNRLISDIALFIPGLRICIYDSRIEPVSDDAMDAILEQYYDFEGQVGERGDICFIPTGFPSYARVQRREPLFYIELILAVDGIRSLFDGFTEAKGGSLGLTNVPFGKTLSSGSVMLSSDSADAAARRDEASADDGSYIKVSQSVSLPGLELERWIPSEEIVRPSRRFLIMLTAISATLAAFLIIYSRAVYRNVRKPVSLIVSAFHRLEQGDLTVKVAGQCDYEFGDIADGFDTMTVKLSQLIDEKYVNEISIRDMELKQMQAQTNPHFFYNSFFMLRRLIAEGDNDVAMKLAAYLGQYYQYIARSDQDMIPLRDEMEHVMNYLNIQMMRFENTLRVDSAHVPDECEAWRVPRLILLPIVENIFKHGNSRSRRVTEIRIAFDYAAPVLKITVEDDGAGMTDETMIHLRAAMEAGRADGESDRMTGLVNIDQRLRLKFRPGSGVRVSRSQLGGACVTLVIVRGKE